MEDQHHELAGTLDRVMSAVSAWETTASHADRTALGDHFVASTPKRQLIIFLGAVLEDADPGEQASILSALPLPARIVWPTIGRRIYARHIRAVRGQNTTSRSR